MAIILFDNSDRSKLFPLTFTRAVADLRVGILKVREWWQIRTGLQVYIHTADYLQGLYEPIPQGEHLWIDASLVPVDDMIDRIAGLSVNEALSDTSGLVAGRHSFPSTQFSPVNSLALFQKVIDVPLITRLEYPWQLFQWNDLAIREDFKVLTKSKKGQHISPTNQLVQHADIFIEEGASVEYSILNSTTGPIYIAKNATVMEGCMIRGPFALGEGATLKMGTKIYGATTIGPNCVAGGEIKNSIMLANSNKAHDGYMGDSVIGEWCNWGAGTSNSNVKNTGGIVKIWNYHAAQLEAVGNKCGLIMGDYSRTAINTSINTGSVIGVCCNVFGEGLQAKLLNNFTWGNKELTRYELKKALQDISNWKAMKGKSLSDAEVSMLQYIFDNM